MKLNRNLPLLTAAAFAAATCFAFLLARADTIGDHISRSVSNQREVKSQTQRAGEDLSNIISEFEKNGLGDEADVQMLKSIRTVLARLSDKDMDKVIALLQAARSATDPAQAKKSATDAFSSQNTIMTELRTILLAYQRQQQLIALSLSFRQMADRQDGNVQSALELIDLTDGSTNVNNYNEPQKALLQVQQSEQLAIRDEGLTLLKKLDEVVPDMDPATAEKLKQVVAHAKESNIAETLKMAVTELDQAYVFGASSHEVAISDHFFELSRLVAPAKDPTTILKEAIESLDRSISEQRFIVTNSKTLAGVGQPLIDAGRQLSYKEARLVKSTHHLRDDLAEIAPDAAVALKQSEDFMQQTRKDLNPSRKEGGSVQKDRAVTDATEAMTALTTARTTLADMLAKIEQLAAKNDPLAQDQALKDQVTALRIAEETLKKDTLGQKDAKLLTALSARQTTLVKTTREVQIVASTGVPAAGQILGDAAKAMDDSASALGTKLNAEDAVPPEQTAIDDLTKAEKLLGDELAKLQDEAKKLAALQAAREQVAKALQDQVKVEMKTAVAAALQEKKDAAATQPNATQPATQPNPADLAKQQDDVKKATDAADNALKDMPDDAKAADDALKDASKDMQTAKDDLDKADPKAADPAAQKAVADLNKAKSALDDKIAELQKDLGKTPDDQAKLDDIAKQLDQAKTDIDKALSDLPKDAIGQIADAQKDLAKQLDQMQQNGQPVGDAAKDAQKAADDLANNNTDAAKADMQKATDDLNKAADAAKADPAAADAAKADADMAKKQADLAKQLADATAQPPQTGNADQAAADMQKAADEMAQAQANDQGALPPDAAADLQKAQADASKAQADAAAGNQQQAKAEAGQAKAELAKAQAAMAQAQMPGQQPGQEPGQEAGPPGQEPGQKPGDKPGEKSDERNAKAGKGERKDANVNADGHASGHSNVGSSKFLALQARDRDAIKQDHNEKYPEEYGVMIQQYLKNLSDNSK